MTNLIVCKLCKHRFERVEYLNKLETHVDVLSGDIINLYNTLECLVDSHGYEMGEYLDYHDISQEFDDPALTRDMYILCDETCLECGKDVLSRQDIESAVWNVIDLTWKQEDVVRLLRQHYIQYIQDIEDNEDNQDQELVFGFRFIEDNN